MHIKEDPNSSKENNIIPAVLKACAASSRFPIFFIASSAFN